MKVAVIGGGPAGCAAGYTLRKLGHEVKLLEAADHVGGRTKQLRRDGFNLATGALFLMGGLYPRTTALIKEMGREGEIIPWGGKTWLARGEERYPVRFVKLASYLRLPLLGFGDRVRLVSEGLKILLRQGPSNAFDGAQLAAYDTGENLEAWSRQHLGEASYEYIVRPIMEFLYAVPMRDLSTPFPLAIIKHALSMELSVPREGIGAVSEWLAQDLAVELGTRAQRIDSLGGGYRVSAGGKSYDADGLVLATEAFTAADLLQGLASDAVIKPLRDI